jgi:NAD+ synthase
MDNEIFSIDALKIDYDKEAQKVAQVLHQSLKQFRKKGVVVALSGGIDSSVVGGLCVRALGKDRVFGLLMPEKDSSSETLKLSRLIAEHLGIQTAHEDITDILESVGCYRRRDEAIKGIIPEYGPDYKCKIVLPGVMDEDTYRIFSVIVQSPDGKQTKARLTPQAYLGIVAATNFKQRTRKMLEYYHADRLNYAVTGTPNRQEYDQGFFVKLGDGAAAIKPIAHLYKPQVYQMARFLEFYFSVPYDKMDLCLYGKNHGISSGDVAAAADLTAEQVQRVYNDIDSKRSTTRYLHSPPIMVEDVNEISH